MSLMYHKLFKQQSSVSILLSLALLISFLTANPAIAKENDPAIQFLLLSRHTDGAKLLFKSGFEGSSQVVPFQGSLHTLVGQDGDFSWETDLPEVKKENAYNSASRSPRFFYIAGDDPDPFVETRIENVLGHTGKPTNALYMAVKDDYLDYETRTRNEFSIYPPLDFHQAYISYWVKFQENYKEVWPEGYGQRMLMELKERSNIGHQQYRWNINVRRIGEELYWHLSGIQVLPEVKVEWGVTNTDIPVPVGEWIRIEAFWRQGDENEGRLWLAMNGQEIADFRGRTQHSSDPQDLHFWSIFKLYTNIPWFETGALQYQLIDDVEIWSDFPRSP